jgi:hypothetical protein
MKKILFIIMIALSNVSFAQIDIGTPGASPENKADERKIKIASKNAEYNGAIVGFAQICGFSPADYGKIEALLFKNLNTVGLNNQQIDEMRGIYNKSISNIKSKGANTSKNECMLFGEEFKKIISTINGGTVKN